jgi:hypothetical protein
MSSATKKLSKAFTVLACMAAMQLVAGAEKSASDDVPGGPAKVNDFRIYRVGTEMNALAAQLVFRVNKLPLRDGHANDESKHLVLLTDTSTSACRLLEEFDRQIGLLYKLVPKGLKVSVVALRNQPAIITTASSEVKETRVAIRRIMEESKNGQMRAKLQLNPGQRRQIQAWDSYVFLSTDDCVKDWCCGVRYCLKELGKDYPIDAIAYVTLDNADSENDIEEVISELAEAKTAFIAAAPETMLTTADPSTCHQRHQFYEMCKKELKLDYGAQFLFHRRETAVNEVIAVDGLDGPMECVGNPTGFGYYGLSRVAYATGGDYLIVADFIHPQCACMFHGPADRLMRVQMADEPIKPGPVPGAAVKAKPHPEIKPYESDPDNQKKYEPCLLSRDAVLDIYQSSPYYQYLFSLGYHNREWNWRAAVWNDKYRWLGAPGDGGYLYGAWQVTPWAAPAKAKAKDAKNAKGGKDEDYDEIEALRIYTHERCPPVAWEVPFATANGMASNYCVFYSEKGVENVKPYLEEAIKAVHARIDAVRSNMPSEKPSKWDHRAIAEIEFFTLCLENQLFYLKQYRVFLDEMVKDPEVKRLFIANNSEEEVLKRLDEIRKEKAPTGHGVPYIAVRMPRLLKQRCEDFATSMLQRPPLYGAEGKADVTRFVKMKKEICSRIGESTWTNFFDLGWQRQYDFVRIEPSWGGSTVIPPPRNPVPPAYQQPPSPNGPGY